MVRRIDTSWFGTNLPSDTCLFYEDNFYLQWNGTVYEFSGETIDLLKSMLLSQEEVILPTLEERRIIKAIFKACSNNLDQLEPSIVDEIESKNTKQLRLRESDIEIALILTKVSNNILKNHKGIFFFLELNHEGNVTIIDYLNSKNRLIIINGLLVGDMAKIVSENVSKLTFPIFWAIQWPEGVYFFVSHPPNHKLFLKILLNAEANLLIPEFYSKFFRSLSFDIVLPTTLKAIEYHQLVTLINLFDRENQDYSFSGVYKISEAGNFQEFSFEKNLFIEKKESYGILPKLNKIRDKRLGIINHISYLTPTNKSRIPFYITMANHAHPRYIYNNKLKVPSYSGGFGVSWDKEESLMISIMEAIERFSIMQFPENDKLIKTSFIKLGKTAIHPHKFPNYLPEQYKSSNFPCRKFNEEETEYWLLGECQTTSKERWIHSDLILWPPLASKPPIVLANSSGTAAHFSVIEAKKSAILELIERHVVLSLWLLQLSPIRISLKSLPDFLKNIIDIIKSYGYKVYILDLRTKFKIPVILILGEAYEDRKNTPFLVSTSSTGFSKIKAIEKGLLDIIRTIIHNKKNNVKIKSQTITLDNFYQPSDHTKFYFSKDKKQLWQFLIQNPNQQYDLTNEDFKEIDLSFEELLKIVSKEGELVFIDRTPTVLKREGISVITAIAENIQPLHFGPNHRRLNNHKISITDFEKFVRLDFNPNAFNPFPHFLS